MVARTAVPAVPTTVALTAAPTVARTAVPMVAPTVARTAVPMVVPMAGQTVARAADPAGVSEGGAPRRPALARCVGDVEVFRTKYWDHEPLLVRAADPARYVDLFSWDAADELLSERGLRTPFLRVVRDGVIQPASAFTASGGLGATIADQVSDDKVALLLSQGATLVLQGLHRTWRPVTDFARELVDELGHPVQVNAYITPAGARGFARHYDVHDVFVLQVEGAKTWQVRPPVTPGPPLPDEEWTRYRDAVERAGAEPAHLDVTLNPGDCLYLPRGWLHEAAAGDDGSVHLTLGIHPVTGRAVLDALVAQLAGEPELRSALPAHADLGGEHEVAAVLARVQALLAQVSPARVHDAVLERADASVRAEPLAPLRQAAAVADPVNHGPYRARRGVRLTVTRSDQGWVARLPSGGQWSGDVAAGALADLLLSGDVVAVEQLGWLGPGRGSPGRTAAAGSPGSRVTAFRCSPASLARGDELAATAAPVLRWVLVEHPGPWPMDPLAALDVSPATRQVLRRWSEAGTRLTLVRRPGRAGRAGRSAGPARAGAVWFVDARTGREGLSEQGEVVLEQLPARFEEWLVAGEPTQQTAPRYLVCTHGRRDVCCSVEGRPVAAELDRLVPGSVWECTHVGGDRFAANVVVLPHGLVYGRLTAGRCAELVEASDAGLVLTDLLRGRSSLSTKEQGAQAWRGPQVPVRAVADLEPELSFEHDDGSATVVLRGWGPVRLRLDAVPLDTPASCHARAVGVGRSVTAVPLDAP